MASEKTGPSKLTLLLAEFIGTAFLLFLGCMGCITDYVDFPVPHYMPAVTFGLSVMIVIQIFGHISGAHLNPAVTMVAVILGHVDLSTAPFYLVGQFAGAILGLGSLKFLVPEEYVATEIFDAATNKTTMKLGLCTTVPMGKITAVQGMLIEAVITAVLIFVCCGIWDSRNKLKQDSIPLRFGFVIAAIAMASGPFTGGSMNTARSFAPAILNGNWDLQWIYWVGPTLGALASVYLYKYLFSVPDSKEEPEYVMVPISKFNEETAKV